MVAPISLLFVLLKLEPFSAIKLQLLNEALNPFLLLLHSAWPQTKIVCLNLILYSLHDLPLLRLLKLRRNLDQTILI